MNAPPFVQPPHNNHKALVVCVHFMQRSIWICLELFAPIFSFKRKSGKGIADREIQ